MPSKYDLRKKGKGELLTDLANLVGQDCQTTADVIANIAEVDDRRLFLGEAYSSMFKYCVDELNIPEGTTCRRNQAARTARGYPVIFEMVAAGDLHLTGVEMLAKHLTADNHLDLLRAAKRMSKRKIQHLLAEWFPQPDVKDTIRKLPEPRSREQAATTSESPATESVERTTPESAESPAPKPGARPILEMTSPPAKRGTVTPLAPRRFKIELTADQELHDMLREAQALTRHGNPSGDLATLLKKALRRAEI